MGQEIQVPAAFANRAMAKAFQGRVDPNDNLADGIGQSFPIISYKGKIWALRHRGERKVVVRPDDGSPSGHLDVVILEQAKGRSKSFYKAYDPSTSEGERPICASIDGIVPDADVTAKQSDTCALCTRNVWKTDPATGRKGRECTDYKRLAVLVMPNQTTPLFGHALMEPFFLRVPPDSLNSLAIMGETMSRQGFHYSTYLTRISFDPVKAHPSMIFRPVQPLTDAEAEVVVELQENPSVKRITGGEALRQGPKMVEQPTGLGAFTAPVTPQPMAQTVEPEQTLLTNLVAPKTEAPKRGRPPKAAAPVQEVVTPHRVAERAAPLAPQGNGQNGSVEADEGVAEPSDDELDAEIAKLISR